MFPGRYPHGEVWSVAKAELSGFTRRGIKNIGVTQTGHLELEAPRPQLTNSANKSKRKKPGLQGGTILDKAAPGGAQVDTERFRKESD